MSENRINIEQADNDEPFDGEVETDETYIGGKRRGKRGRGAEGKTPVFGIVKRSLLVLGHL